MRTRLWVVRVLFLPFLGLVFWGWAHGAFARQEAVMVWVMEEMDLPISMKGLIESPLSV